MITLQKTKWIVDENISHKATLKTLHELQAVTFRQQQFDRVVMIKPMSAAIVAKVWIGKSEQPFAWAIKDSGDLADWLGWLQRADNLDVETAGKKF